MNALSTYSAVPSIWNAFDELFSRENGLTQMPKVNIRETGENFELELAAPGLKKENFELVLDKNVLSIRSKQSQESEKTEGKYTRREFSYQAFERSFTLPQSVDQEAIGANYEHGILRVTLPKKDSVKVQAARAIEIA